MLMVLTLYAHCHIDMYIIGDVATIYVLTKSSLFDDIDVNEANNLL